MTYDTNQTIGKLRFGMKGINVNGKIVEIPPVRRVFTKWGTEAYVSNVKLADEDESIRFGLWNNRIKTVRVGDEVEIKNCSVTWFAGELQLKLGRKGSVSVIDQS
jgi:ssDNA-binding replication factor A large subunit